ncbi:MAG: hypothetical protein Q8O76_06230 [Chloroflexota bacterium]|nr:hypothetical protein [Chloroflexota bacterium]
MLNPKKKIVKRLHPVCILQGCPRQGKPMNVTLYEDGTYRGGHYFGRLLGRGRKGEYWECPSCFWRKKTDE